MSYTVLELTVNNHPGVMSHVCGLFARRLYNMEGILCLPTEDDAISRIWILLNEDRRLKQVIKQTSKLLDVISVQHHSEMDHQQFLQLDKNLVHKGKTNCMTDTFPLEV